MTDMVSSEAKNASLSNAMMCFLYKYSNRLNRF
jgi:hypothetical protein